MHIQSLSLRDFRLYSKAHFEFGPQVNVIFGPNAQGKTTILEAIYLLMTGKSFRSPQIKDVIREGSSSFSIEATFVKHGIEQTLKFSSDGKEKKIFHNQTPCTSLSGLLGLMQGVVMVPDDVALIKGAPRIRRRYLDLQLVQIDPLYVHFLTRYCRAMRHRNHLLRQKNTATIEVWEQEMAKAGAYLVKVRARAIRELHQGCRRILSALSEANDELSLEYQTQVPSDEKEGERFLLHKYHSLRNRELIYGNTLVGPHKEDVQILINGQDARYFASEGQQRSSVTALRFAEWERLYQLAEDPPMMLIDDIGISLDESRKKKVFSLIENFQQVFLTTTEALDIASHQITLGSSCQRV